MSTTSPFREDTEAGDPFASAADLYEEAFDEGESWDHAETDEAAGVDVDESFGEVPETAFESGPEEWEQPEWEPELWAESDEDIDAFETFETFETFDLAGESPFQGVGADEEGAWLEVESEDGLAWSGEGPDGAVTFAEAAFEDEVAAAPAADPARVLTDLVQQALGGSSRGAAEGAAAFRSGERDVNRLTNVIFHARHPELRGRSIKRGETVLAKEWVRIRDKVVVPALPILAAAAVVVTPTRPVVAPASPFILPPSPAHLRPPARAQIDAVPLFPASRVIDVETDLIRTVASRPDGWVYMTNWYAGLPNWYEGTPLAGSKPPIAIALENCAHMGGTIRALLWEGSLRQLDPILRGIVSPLAAIGGVGSTSLAANLIRQYLTKYTNQAVNSATAAYINRLPKAVARLDDATLTVGSHHQKILVVGNDERTVAVLGGVDLHSNRVLRRGGGSPLHDISVQLDGQAAADVADVFERRWNADASRRSIPLPPRKPPRAPRPATGATVQIGVNYGCRRPLTDVGHGIQGGSQLITNLFLKCRSFFYVEDQYGLGHDDLAVAIRRAFENGARYGVVVLANAKGVEDMPEIDYWRYRFWSRFPQIGRNLFVFERVGDDGDPNGPHAYVHSKLVLVDDSAVSISSLNISRRSWYHDSEIGAVITDAPQRIADFRTALWSAHLTIGQDGLRNPAVGQLIWMNAYLGFGPRPRLNPLRYLMSKTPPRRRSAELVPSSTSTILGGLAGGLVGGLGLSSVRGAIDSVMDRAHWLIFDPRGPDSC